MLNEINAQMSATPQAVQLWMNWMGLIFMLSIVFAWKHIEARWVLGVTVLSMPGVLAVFALWGNVHLFGIVHLILWTPLLVYLVRRRNRSDAGRSPRWTAYRIWSILLMATIAVSLLFDVRDIYLVVTGTKALP